MSGMASCVFGPGSTPSLLQATLDALTTTISTQAAVETPSQTTAMTAAFVTSSAAVASPCQQMMPGDHVIHLDSGTYTRWLPSLIMTTNYCVRAYSPKVSASIYRKLTLGTDEVIVYHHRVFHP